MMSYDDWKNDFPEEQTNECDFCGESCEDNFCNRDCQKAYIADNTDRGDD